MVEARKCSDRRRAGKFISLSGFKLVVLFCLSIGLPVGAVTAEQPQAPVGRLHDALLGVMQEADALGFDGRFDTLQPILQEVFDFEAMTALAVGRSWRELEGTQRQQLIELFSDMSVASFAARFDGYSGERFEITGEGEGPRGASLVETRIVRPDDEPVGIDYLLRPSDDDWRIIDIFLDSKFSELARQRAEFAGVLKSGGYDALVAEIEDKIEALSSGNGA